MERSLWTDERLDDAMTRIERRFAEVDRRFDQIDARLDRMDARFDRIEAELLSLHRLLAQMGFGLAGLFFAQTVAVLLIALH